MKYQKFLVASFIAIGGLALAAQTGQILQRTLVENSVDTYKLTSKVDQTLTSPIVTAPINVVSKMTFKLKTNKVDASKGSADVEATTSVDSIDAGDGPLSQLFTGKKLEPVVQNGTIDKFGHLSLKDSVGGDPNVNLILAASGSLQSALFVDLPDHAVKIGDSWDIVIPKGPFSGDTDQKLTAKLTGEQKVNGKDAWTVDLSGSMTIQFDSDKLPPPQKYHVIVKSGSVTVTGTGTVDKITGKTLTLSTTGNMKSTIELPDQGDLTGDIAGTLSTDVKLQD